MKPTVNPRTSRRTTSQRRAAPQASPPAPRCGDCAYCPNCDREMASGPYFTDEPCPVCGHYGLEVESE